MLAIMAQDLGKPVCPLFPPGGDCPACLGLVECLDSFPMPTTGSGPESQAQARRLHAFADVVVPRHLNRAFTYRVPAHLQHRVCVGSFVHVPFGASTLQGVVVSLSTAPPRAVAGAAWGGKVLREIRAILDEPDRQGLDHEALEIARFVADYYLAPLGQCVRLLAPAPLGAKRQGSYVLTEAGRQACREQARVGQTGRAVLARLADSPKGLTSATLRRTVEGPVLKVLRDLRKRQWIEECTETPAAAAKVSARRHTNSIGSAEAESGILPQSSHETEEALRLNVSADWVTTITKALDAGRSSPFLIHADASYRWACLLEACAVVLGRGRGALVITGDVARASALARFTQARWGSRVGLLHGGLSERARSEVWSRIRDGQAAVVVGTRSAVFAPISSPGLVWVDGEEDTSLKEEQEPRYHAGHVAAVLARRSGAVLVLGSQHPSVETVVAAGAEGQTFRSSEESSLRRLIDCVDLRRESPGTILSASMLDGIAAALTAGTGVVLYHNRKGYAPQLTCRDCGSTPRCTQCSVVLTLYQQTGRVTCHYCGSGGPIPQTCSSCSGTRVSPVGFGTERLESELRRLFPRARVARLDRESVRLKADSRRIRAQVSAKDYDVLIGTRMLFRSGPLPPAGFVGVPLADADLHLPDFRAAERTYHGLLDAVSLARSAADSGHVVIQTYLPTHHAVRAVVSDAPDVFYEEESGLRRALGYPPFSALIGLRVSGSHASRVREGATRWAEVLKETAGQKGKLDDGLAVGATAGFTGICVLGPIPAHVNRVRGRHRWQLLVKGSRGDVAREIVRESLERLERDNNWRGLKFEVDVDPVEIA